MIFAGVAPQSLRVVWGTRLRDRLAAARLARAPLRAARADARWPACERRLRAWQAGVLASGALWGIAAWFFSAYGSAPHQIALVLVVYTFCVASVPILGAAVPPVRRSSCSLIFAPAIARVVLDGSTLGWQLGAVMTVAMGMTMLLGRNYRESFERIVGLKLRTEALAVQLRAEKAVADAARHEAEVANRAKTQFFTAASHDLRQPLHAMGLFAEALRARAHDPEVAQLVNSINESVDALEGLFSELLDITRIDSGGVEVNPENFELADIFRKVRLHFEPAAFEKGLALRIRGGRHVALADPLLVERIVRNLVSNAIRYTARRLGAAQLPAPRRAAAAAGLGHRPGHPRRRARAHLRGVLPGAGRGGGHGRAEEGPRPRPGDRQAAVRADGGAARPALARSAAARCSRSSCRSARGRATTARSIAGKGPIGITLDGRLIVIVEDEPAVREGLEVLLTGWGATIVSLGERRRGARLGGRRRPGGAAGARHRRLPARQRRDRRRRDRPSLRERFGRGVPAIVVTGSSMTGHDKEALEHDFHLLIKPVLPNKLRAMIAFKLGRR